MMRSNKERQDLHPIKVVARRTGLTPDVLRAWERRYEAITPARSSGSRRFYSSADIERLMLLRKLTLGGRSIGQIARLPLDELERLAREDEAAALQLRAIEARARLPEMTPSRPTAGEDAAVRLVEQCLGAVHELDVGRLRLALDAAFLELGRIAAIEQVLLPLMHAIGARWREGEMRIAHEHLASAVVRTLLSNLAQESGVSDDGAPVLVAATPSGQQHEFGALVAVATAGSEGWSGLYLGANLPAEEIAAAARHKRARAIALSLVYPADDPRMPEELTRLRRLLPEPLAIFAGGCAAGAYRESLVAIQAVRLDSMQEFRRELEALRTGRA